MTYYSGVGVVSCTAKPQAQFFVPDLAISDLTSVRIKDWIGRVRRAFLYLQHYWQYLEYTGQAEAEQFCNSGFAIVSVNLAQSQG